MIYSKHSQSPGNLFSKEETQAGECAPWESCKAIKLSSGLATGRGGPSKGQTAHTLAAKPVAEHPGRGRKSAGQGPETGPRNSFNRCFPGAPPVQCTRWSDCTQTAYRKFDLVNTYYKSSLLAWHFMCLSSREGETRGGS